MKTMVYSTRQEIFGRKTATEQRVNVGLVKLSVQQWRVVFSDVYLDHSQETLIRADVAQSVLVSEMMSTSNNKRKEKSFVVSQKCLSSQ